MKAGTTQAIRPCFEFQVTMPPGSSTYTILTNWGQTFEGLSRKEVNECAAEMERQGATEHERIWTPKGSSR